MAELYRTIENPLVVVLARMEHAGIAVDRRRAARRCNARLTDRGPAARRRAEGASSGATTSTSTRRSSCARSSTAPPPAGRGLTPVKKTKTGASTDAGYAGEAAGPSGPSSSGRCCSTARSRSCVARTARVCSPRSPRTGGSTPRSTRPSPAPGGSARTARTCTTSRCAARRAGCSARRSSPRRAASCSSPTTTRSSCAASPTSPPTPGLVAAFTSGEDIHNATAARDLRRRPGRRHARPALEGEDGVVRARLRDGGVRPRPAPEHPHRGGGEDPRRLLRGLPEREGVHGRHRRRGPQAWATPRRCSAAAGRSPSCSTATGGSARRGSARR